MIKRKATKVIIAAVTVISLGLLGCSNQNPNKSTSNSATNNNTGQTQSTSTSTDNKAGNETNQTESNSGANNSPSKKPVEEAYYGKWQIKKELASAPVSTYSSDDIKAIIGKKLTFSKEGATCFGDKIDYLNLIAINPTYKKSVISKNDFEANNHVTFHKLGIEGDTITKVEVYDTKGNGCTFFIKDNNTLILIGGGEYFELNKI